MRVRLKIERHELPITRILWNISPETTTISKLLDQIEAAVPLESRTWSIDDYAVEVNGYEALHYAAPHSILREDDEVRIRPLQASDIRNRYISGRTQISPSGIHLMDGVAWGKMPSNRICRPDMYIPARKRPREEYEEDDPNQDDEETENPPKRLREVDGSEEADDEPNNIEDEVEGEVSIRDTTGDGGSAGEGVNGTNEQVDGSGILRTGKRRKSVSFDESSLSAAHDDEDEDEDDDGDYQPDDGGRDDDFDLLLGGDEVSDAGTALHHSVEGQANGKESSASMPKKTAKKSPKPRPSSSKDSASSSSDSSSDSDSVSSVSSSDLSDGDSSDSAGGSASQMSTRSSGKPAVNGTSKKAPDTSAAKQTQPPVAPGQGKSRTHHRNQRRKELKRHLAIQRLAQEQTNSADTDAEASGQSFDTQRQNLLDSIAAGGVDITTGTKAQSARAIGPQAYPSQDILDSQRSSDSTTNTRRADEAGTTELPSAIEHSGVSMTSQAETPIPEASEKAGRSRLDLKGSSRMIFAGLGVRTPRTKDDQDKVRNQLAGKRNAKDKSQNATAPAEQAVASDETGDHNAWKTKIKLAAVECVDEGVILSTPPFPFKQRWDPQQQNKGKKRKRSSQQYYEQDDSFYNDQASGEGLNYDDPIDESLVRDSQQDDLPTLPADMSSLVEPSKTDFRPQAIIAFKQLEVSQTTGWEPRMSHYKTALIEEFDEDTDMLKVQLAKRDCPNTEPEYDDNGKRIYGKFEMDAGDEDVNMASGLLELEYHEMVEPKLVRPAPQATSPPTQEGASQANTIAETTMVPESMVEDQTHDSIFTSEGVASNLAEPGTQRDSQASERSSGGVSNTTSTARAAASEGATPGHSQGGLVEASA